MRWAALLIIFSFLTSSVRADEAAVCRECHLTKSSAVLEHKAPSLAGQHPEYIVKQLERFAGADKDDPYRRINTSMAHTLKRLPKYKWASVAKRLSEETCTNYGDKSLSTPSPNPCGSCHGARGISENPEIPNLAGQDIRYLFHQYMKLREPYTVDIPGIEKSRTPNRLHPTMGPISARLNDGVVSIMIYYSKLPCR